MLGPTEWILIALIVIVLFGGKKIPELAKGLGKGIREFKSAKNQIEKVGGKFLIKGLEKVDKSKKTKNEKKVNGE